MSALRMMGWVGGGSGPEWLGDAVGEPCATIGSGSVIGRHRQAARWRELDNVHVHGC